MGLVLLVLIILKACALLPFSWWWLIVPSALYVGWYAFLLYCVLKSFR